jgi:hypothetical protein
VRVLEADLAQPRLGLSAAATADTVATLRALRLRAVVHAAAVVPGEWGRGGGGGGYRALRRANVESTEALWELLVACQPPGGDDGNGHGLPPPVFVFVSSLSAVPPRARQRAAAAGAGGGGGGAAVAEYAEALLPAAAALKLPSAYGQSKLIAECRLAACAAAAASADSACVGGGGAAQTTRAPPRLVIARLGLLGPSAGDGDGDGVVEMALNRRDWLATLLRAIGVRARARCHAHV